MIEGFNFGTDEEAHQERAAWSQDPRELVEHGRDCAGLVMDQRVPGEDPADTRGGFCELVEAAECERNSGVGQAGMVDELGNLVHAAHVVAVFGEVTGPVSRTAASIQDRAFDFPGPGSDQRPIGGVERRY